MPTRHPRHEADSRYAWTRLAATLALMTIGSGAMYVIAVVLPAVQAEFGVARADATLPYTLLLEASASAASRWARQPTASA